MRLFIFLHIQTVRIQQEIIHTDDQNSVIGVTGSGGVFDHDDLLEGIIDTEQGIGFLLHFCFVGDGESRLNIVALGALVANKVHFQLLADILAGTILSGDAYQPHIHIEISCDQFVEQDVFHGMIFFDLPEVNPGITKTYIAEIVFLRSVDVLSAFNVITGSAADNKGIAKIIQITLNSVDADFDVFLGFESVCQLLGVGQRSDAGGQNVDQFFKFILVADSVSTYNIVDIGLFRR